MRVGVGRSFVEPQEAMEQYSLSCWRKTVCVPLRVYTETFAQIHGKVRNIELVARHDERDALSNETRAVVCAQPRRHEDDKGVDGGANQGNVLRNVRRRSASVDSLVRRSTNPLSSRGLRRMRTVALGA